MTATDPTTHRPRLVFGVSPEDYHAGTAGDGPMLSASVAKTLNERSPAHAYLEHPLLGGKRRKLSSSTRKTFDRGTVIHGMVLGTGREIVVVDAENWRTKAAQQEQAEAEERGAVAILPHQLTELQEAADAILAQLADLNIELTGQSEVAAYWTELADDGTAVQCCGQLDHLALPVIYDLKTSESAHPRKIKRSCDSYSYDIQAAAYPSALACIRPDLAGTISYKWIFCETDPPYSVTLAEPAGTMRALGEWHWRRAVNLWARCLRENRWPHYSQGVERIEATPWAMAEMLEAG